MLVVLWIAFFVLTAVAFVAIVVTGRYPRGIFESTARYPRGVFDFLLGLNRWIVRVAAYVALMTDEYPPFRLDPGARETGVAVSSEHGG